MKRDWFSIWKEGDGVCDVRAVNQSRAEDRNGSNKSTEGRVNPWSRISAGGSASGLALAAWASRSLFFNTRRRFLGGMIISKNSRMEDESTLSNMIESVQ